MLPRNKTRALERVSENFRPGRRAGAGVLCFVNRNGTRGRGRNLRFKAPLKDTRALLRQYDTHVDTLKGASKQGAFGQSNSPLPFKRIDRLYPKHLEVTHIAGGNGQTMHDRRRGNKCIVGKCI